MNPAGLPGIKADWSGIKGCGILFEASRGQGDPCLKGTTPEQPSKIRPIPADKEKKMPKLKTHTGAAKRFSKTGTGKIKRGQTKTRHILTSKGPKTKRKLGRTVLVSDGDYKKVARMIPYA
jgi:large subunit ribosomal protein L35